MKCIFFSAFFLPLTLVRTLPLSIQEDPHADLFVAWKEQHQKEYLSGVEEVSRFNIWKDNMRKVMLQNMQHDLGLSTFTMEMNEFADMTADEFGAQRLGMRKRLKATVPEYSSESSHEDDSSVPASVDWRDQGWVTPVKNQGQCGSCWSFSTTGGLEGQNMNATGKLIGLSEQQLVDCDHTDGGCNGGDMGTALTWLARNGGSIAEADYRYVSGITERRGTCKDEGKEKVVKVSHHVQLPRGNENLLKETVATVGPCSIAIDASHSSFQLYKDGIYDPAACSQYSLDHAVLVVGYGGSGNEEFWWVKNSWGKSWGLSGYIKMARNKNNKCGVASEAIYPVVA